MIRLKPGTNLDGVTRQVFQAIAAADAIWGLWGCDLWVTSARDGVHPGGKRPSFHPLGQAVDLRTHNLPKDARQQAVDQLRMELGDDYDVIFEGKGTPNEHAHVQWDPIA